MHHTRVDVLVMGIDCVEDNITNVRIETNLSCFGNSFKNEFRKQRNKVEFLKKL